MTENVIEIGRAAWKRIREGAHWEDWTRVGRALEVGRGEAMRDAHTNRPVGSGYNSAFSVWLDANGFGDMDKATRSQLASCMGRIAEIERWRGTIGDKRHKLNHPSAVWRAFVAATRVPGPKAPSPMARLHDRNVELQEEVHALEEQIKRLGGGSNIDFASDSIPDMARMIARDLMTANRIRRLMHALGTEAKRMEKDAATPGDRNGAATDPRQQEAKEA